MTQDDFVITDDNIRKWLLWRNDHMNIVMANIMKVLTFTRSDPPWLEVLLGESLWSSRSSSWLWFKMSEVHYYVPLRWNEWSVACRISLPINHAHWKQRIFNHQMTWKIKDHWPTDTQPDDNKGSSNDNKDNEDKDNNNESSSNNHDNETSSNHNKDNNKSSSNDDDNKSSSSNNASKKGSGDSFVISSSGNKYTLFYCSSSSMFDFHLHRDNEDCEQSKDGDKDCKQSNNRDSEHEWTNNGDKDERSKWMEE